jgi:L-ascorbate metabolism protein UlaG (beta-lactamase superfamily)
VTDPVFGSRIGIALGLGTAGPKRYIAPALKLKELPPIDVVLLSHAHMDHMDLPSLAKLKRSLRITAKSTMDIFGAADNVRELSWGDKTVARTRKGELEVEAFEAS